MTGSGPSPLTWAMHDGRIGMTNQVLGLAEAVGYGIVDKQVTLRAPWRHLAP